MPDKPKRSFIEQARRNQIVEAAVETLAELGYSKTSLAQIAKRAHISTALISYHFKDKEDLMFEVLTTVGEEPYLYVETEVNKKTSARDKLKTYIESKIFFMGTRPKKFKAMLEIVMGARKEDGQLTFSLEEDESSLGSILEILEQGQKNGEFRDFSLQPMALAINGMIDQVLINTSAQSKLSLEHFAAEAVELFDRATKK